MTQTWELWTFHKDSVIVGNSLYTFPNLTSAAALYLSLWWSLYWQLTFTSVKDRRSADADRKRHRPIVLSLPNAKRTLSVSSDTATARDGERVRSGVEHLLKATADRNTE